MQMALNKYYKYCPHLCIICMFYLFELPYILRFSILVIYALNTHILRYFLNNCRKFTLFNICLLTLCLHHLLEMKVLGFNG